MSPELSKTTLSTMSILNKEIFDSFSQSYDPPQWIIEDLLESGEVEVKAALIEALEAIPDTAADQIDENTHATLEITFRSKDRSERAKLYLLSCLATRALYQTRLAEVSIDDNKRAKPYNLPILNSVTVDAEGLVPLSAFEIKGDALCFNGYAFFILSAISFASCSSVHRRCTLALGG